MNESCRKKLYDLAQDMSDTWQREEDDYERDVCYRKTIIWAKEIMKIARGQCSEPNIPNTHQ